MSVERVTDFALCFFMVVALIGLAVRAWDFDQRWLDAPTRVGQSR